MAATAMSPCPKENAEIEAKHQLTPPFSEENNKHDDDSSSDLSDLELDTKDNSEIEPDHYYEGGKIPVFKPTMAQFRDFKVFIDKIDKYGMKSGIVKVIPPKQWRDELPELDEQIKSIRVKNPISQEFHGSQGTWTQANMEKQRSYNLPQWKTLCEESNHQPPARRGERRRNQEKVVRGAATRMKKTPVVLPDGKKRGPGRPRVRPLPSPKVEEDETALDINNIPTTPTSPLSKPVKVKKERLSDDENTKGRGHQPKSVSSRRKHNRGDHNDIVDEEAFKDFDYRIHNQDEWTAERCQELETSYWKSLTFNNPMYGADMPGSLFDDRTKSWNVAKLENLLDVLGQKVPGVNTAYLYLGMWKATFAWHLEDVDLYSINYIHFGAPKQWYSISQEDARRFEAAMRTIWPNDAKNCDQFLRHKTYLISPQLLQSQFNIKVNRLVHYEGEFVITYPYGYHSGYNLGYNCAESVNFATEAWLDYGKVAKKCNCEADSVWVDVYDIERKLRGEQTPEYYEETDEDEDEEADEDGSVMDLPTPPGSVKGKVRVRSHKRKRSANDKDAKPKIKKIRLKISTPAKEPCILCPNDPPFEDLLPTDTGSKAHRRCALFTPETSIVEEGGVDTVCDIALIDKARLELKCNYCRSKRGAVFQCSSKKCIRAYHATCGASAGVQVETGMIPIFAEDGTEYTKLGTDFRCRFHRPKRQKFGTNFDCITVLEQDNNICKEAPKLQRGDIVQVQYYHGDIFAGYVLENRESERTLLVDIFPKREQVEVEYKWILLLDKANSQLPVPSENAKPLPTNMARTMRTSTEDPLDATPKAGQAFDPEGRYIWQEFHFFTVPPNPHQVRIDMSKPKMLWYYLGNASTEAKAHYTGDLGNPHYDPASNFLESVRMSMAPTPVIPRPIPRTSFPTARPASNNTNALNAARANMYVQQQQQQQQQQNHLQQQQLIMEQRQVLQQQQQRLLQQQSQQQMQASPQQVVQAQPAPINRQMSFEERPYNGKYAIKDDYLKGGQVDPQALRNQQAFLQSASTYSQHNPRQLGYPQLHHSSTMPMAGVSPTLPTMADVHRRSSQSQLAEVADFKNSALQPARRDLPPPRSRGAPIANMMSNGLPSSQPNSRPQSSQWSASSILGAIPTAPSTPNQVSIAEGRARSESVRALAAYPYLHEAALARPAVYQSPYAPGSGFTEWKTDKTAIVQPTSRSRSTSLMQDFLSKATPSQREAVKGHVRTISTDKAVTQQKEAERRVQEQKRFSYFGPEPAPVHTSTTTGALGTSTFETSNTYGAHSPFPDFDSYSTPSTGFSNQLAPDPLSFGPSQLHAQPPLQYSSPQDFQAQMRRAAQKPTILTNFDHLMRGLQQHSGAPSQTSLPNLHGHPQNQSFSRSGDGTSGSPLRGGFEGRGKEMLPMMGQGELPF